MLFRDKVREYNKLLVSSEADAKKRAEEFYYRELVDEVSELFKQKVQKAEQIRKCRYLIVSVGFSPEPAIFWIRALTPEKVFFLCTNDSVSKLDKIVEVSGIKASKFSHETFDSNDVAGMYKEIKEIIEKNNLGGKLDQVAVDITGGKKSMVSVCALAASFFGVRTIYVDYGKNNRHTGKPEPGSEFPVIVPDPQVVYGDKELTQGVHKFNSGNFVGAKEIFASIKDKSDKPKLYEALELLAVGYTKYEAMQFAQGGAYDSIQKAINIARDYKLRDFPVGALEKQLKYLEPLKKIRDFSEKEILGERQLFWYLMGYFVTLANYYGKQGKADLAGLLTYRCLEMLSQYLLRKHGLYTTKPDYSKFDEKELLEKYNEINKTIYHPFVPDTALPRKIALMAGLALLKVLGDPVIDGCDLKKILKKTDLRNKSRFAHGFVPLKEDEVKEFYFVVFKLIEQAWQADREEGSAGNFSQLAEQFKFVELSL